MARSSVVLLLLFISLVLFAPSVPAQEIGASLENRVPFARAGYFYGRTGTAKGSSGYLEINPSRWLGFCGFVSHSRNSSDLDGGHAQAWDFTSGVCVTTHFPEVKGFLISPFFQIEYQSDHDRFVIPLGDGTSYQDGENHRHHLLTAGTSVDRAIVKNGPRWAVRAGKNFGVGPAAENAGGLYLVGGIFFPLDHPVKLARSLRRMVGWKSHAADSSPAHP